MKNKFFGKNVILSVIFLIVIVGIFVLFKGTYTLDNDSTTYTRKDLQDMVVSTALSYLHNNRYTDYDQKPMDKTGKTAKYSYLNSKDEIALEGLSSFNWRNPNVSPEEASRTNIFSIDCSSFAAIVYKYSLGYDFSEYYELSNSLYPTFNTDTKHFVKNSINKKKEEGSRIAFNQFGMGTKGRYYMAITAKSFDIKDSEGNNNTENTILNYYDVYDNGKLKARKNDIDTYDENGATFEEQFKPYIDASNTKIGTFLYEVKIDKEDGFGDEKSQLERVNDEMVNLLEPGDIVTYVRNPGTEKNPGTPAGHTMVYVGDIFNIERPGFIHSAPMSDGGDYKVNEYTAGENKGKIKDVSIGDGLYGVRFDTVDYLISRFNQVEEDVSDLTYLVAITRPINKYLSEELKSREKAPDNAGNDRMILKNENIATNGDVRSVFKWIRTEQYVTKTTSAINTDVNGETGKKLVNLTDEKVNISKYNSINEGERITYNLELENKSVGQYCIGGTSGGGYSTTREDCEVLDEDGEPIREWKTLGEEEPFKDITVVAKIPKNAEYVSCSGGTSCEYYEDDREVVFKVKELKPATFELDEKNFQYLKTVDLKKLSYTVKVTGGDKIINAGMEITYDGNTLKMGQLETKVNPTINELDIDKMLNELTVTKIMNSINNFDKAIKKGNIVYGSSGSDYKTKIDDDGTTNKVNLNASGFIKNIYYNAFDIELDELTGSNVKDAIFNGNNYNKVTVDNVEKEYAVVYAKKTEEEIAELEKTDKLKKYAKINKMLVKGFYGGRYLKGNDNGDRPGRLRITDLEVGDIIVFYNSLITNANADYDDVPAEKIVARDSFMWMYLGNGGMSDCEIPTENVILNGCETSTTPAENDKLGAFIRFTDAGLKIVNSTTDDVTAHQFFNELWSKDLFVVLRPSQLFTMVKYSGSALYSGISSSFEYGTYKNLVNPTTKDGTVMLDYNNDEYNCTDCKTKYLRKEVFGWYASKDATEPLYYDNANFYKDLVSDKTHIIYGKWEFALPQVVVNGKVLSGWYKDEALSNKVGDAYAYGIRYTIVRDVNETLYAKWEDEITYSHNDKCENVGDKLYCKINENTDVLDFKDSIGVKPGYKVDIDSKTIDGKELIYTGGKTGILRSWDSSNDEIVRYTNVVRGDTDGDGVVSASDVSKMFQYYRGTNEDPIKDISIMAGDVVKNDGEIKLTDVAKLFQYANGKIDSLG